MINSKIFFFFFDQKPNLPLEMKRINEAGGEIKQMVDKYGNKAGPFRVWFPQKNYPGLAMSRSLGDRKGKGCGIISQPEFIEYQINNYSKYMVIASDGIWEFIGNEEVRNIGNKFFLENDIKGLSVELIKVATNLWEMEDIVRDDITIVTVFF